MFDAILTPAMPGVNPSVVSCSELSYSIGNCGHARHCCLYCIGDLGDLGWFEIGVHGEAQDSLSCPLGVRVGAFPQIQVGEDGLQVEWDRVVDGGRDSGLLQGLLESVAVVYFDSVLGPGAGVSVADYGGLHDVLQQVVVSFCGLLARCQLVVEYIQLGQQDRGLDGVESAVDADADVVIAAVLSVIAELQHLVGEVVVVGEERSAVAVATEGLRREETGAADRAQVAGLAAFVGSSEALGGVFDYSEPVLGCDGIDRVHVCALAVETDRHDGLCTRRDRRFDLRVIDVVGFVVDVDEDGNGSEQRDHLAGGEEGEGRSNDLITCADSQGHHRKQQGVGAAGAADAVLRSGARCKLRFEFGDFRAENVLAVIEDGLNAGVDVGFQVAVLRFEVDELHFFIFALRAARYSLPPPSK